MDLTRLAIRGGIASSMPEFMVRRMPIDVVVQEEGEVTFSEVLHRLEARSSVEGVRGTAYRHVVTDARRVANNS